MCYAVAGSSSGWPRCDRLVDIDHHQADARGQEACMFLVGPKQLTYSWTPHAQRAEEVKTANTR